MRRIATPADAERGGIAVIVALLMVVLLGFAAIAVDVGMLYSERAQLQNGSDSAALMVAQKCAKNPADDNCSTAAPLAPGLASGNALDGKSGIKSIELDKAARTVTVTTVAQETGGAANTVSLFFARALGFASTEVNTSSSVRWGSPLEGTTPFPLAFSICQVSGMVGGPAQLVQNHSASGTSKGNPACALGPAGQTVPGGFGWVLQNPGSCSASVDLAIDKSGGETGNDAPENCASVVAEWQKSILAGKDVTVLLPVFHTVTGTGASTSYDLVAFAAFKIIGWRLASGNGTNASLIFHNTKEDVGSALACTGDCRGIIGQFVNYVSLADGYKLGPVSAYGATVVELTN